MGDVVVAQVEHLRKMDRRSERQRDRRRTRIQWSFLHMPPSQAADPGSPAAPQTACCCVGRAAWAETGLWTHQSPPTPAGSSSGPASRCCPDALNFLNETKDRQKDFIFSNSCYFTGKARHNYLKIQWVNQWINESFALKSILMVILLQIPFKFCSFYFFLLYFGVFARNR